MRQPPKSRSPKRTDLPPLNPIGGKAFAGAVGASIGGKACTESGATGSYKALALLY
ncbi:hypothetical protein [Mucilaginibacter glaciei]|uniref:Uncharacterized protein n=1 Tax=Mucilaginibacter glaciei TaxID=2772109 RepID=A0A926NVJ8_9SPHI|nr:hypothetical protein [Mucilaginibacter glaciei]MBD1395495.1 hypothetical protein [Mucilaginibacter glaciei]